MRLAKTYPRPPASPLSSAHLIPEGQPSGGMSCGGMGSAPAAGLARQTREASGHRSGGTTAPARGARWEARRERFCNPRRDEAGIGPRSANHFSGSSDARDKAERSAFRAELASRRAGPEPESRRSAARSLDENADRRSATGRAEGGSILPRRILAQWKRLNRPAPRGAPLPLEFQNARAQVRAGENTCVILGRPQGDPRISGRTRLQSLLVRRCPGQARA